MNRLALASLAVFAGASGIWLACSNNPSTPTGGSDGGVTVTDGGGVGEGGGDGGLAPALACADTIASVYGDPGSGFASLAKGAIIHCAHDRDLTMAQLQASVTANISTDVSPTPNTGYIGKPMTSGVHIYRVSYRTERGDTAGSPGYSSAELLIPDTPRAPNLPVLVASHGSRGQAGECTASEEEDAGQAVNGDYEALGLPLAGLGYAVMLPDLAGYANYGAAGNPPSAYADAEDVGKSTLDGARAMTNLLTSGLSDKVVIIGHSQGGHTAFASVAIAPQYAPELNIVAAGAYSPLWLSQATWGAILFEAADYPIATNQGANAVSIWYHYTHGVLLDGPDAGLEMFAPDKSASVTAIMNDDCWDTWPDLLEAGTTATDIFSPSFVTSVAQPAALGTPCAGGDTTCATWLARYAADRPHLSTKIPFLIEYGALDETIPPSRMACVIQRLGAPTALYPGGDNVNLTFCLDPGWGHEGIVRAHAADMADWIAAQTLGGPQPAPCQYNASNLVQDDAGNVSPADDAGIPVTCETPPPNN